MIDRFNQYLENGFNVLLQLENNFYTYEKIKKIDITTIKPNPFHITDDLKSEITTFTNKKGRPRGSKSKIKVKIFNCPEFLYLNYYI